MPYMREEFEAWYWRKFGASSCVPRTHALKRNGSGYFDPNADARWESWQASRAALKVELPRKGVADQYCDNDERLEIRGFNDCLEQVKEALQQAGIEVKQ